ncbi:transglutaminase-like domain-containing protein [Flavivirga aquimarina]|uniref:Transglutaminase-like domain-containing protein n=1 Tax=Flavivirga aquimarina TaxID=2027862 RepID=A0ABT8W5I3_9FLAO|nr:transglutaminase-like domain-containing protein [Flavivirga aquimarina]MDO5968374.1 transglutaminase-like domain-containing protein [Flavivirga aquimarina]
MSRKAILTISFFLGSLFLFSQSLEDTLELFKENKQNLQTVLSHYSKNGEEEKYQAALFLIKNMPIHKSINYQWINIDKNKAINFTEFDFPDYKLAFKYLKKLNDSIKIRPKKNVEYDVNSISSEFLIKNIDAAFLEWKKNIWSKGYSFETFCEYILPYRSLTEPLENWREDYKVLANRTKYMIDDVTDPVAICTQIISSLDEFTFINKRPDPIPFLSPSQMLFRRQGSCPDLANFALMVCRSKGIAATFDFTPHYAASSNRHFWNTVVDTNGNHIPFNSNAINDANDCLPYIYNANRKRLGKVFRKTFSIQENTLANIIPLLKIPKGALRDKNIKDVTSEYVEVSNLSVNNNKFNDSIAYINVFNLGEWKVIDWGKENMNMMTFQNMGRDLVYLPSTYSKGKMTYLSHPFLIDKEGEQYELIPDTTSTFSGTLSRFNERKTDYIDFNTLEIIEGEKYRLFYWDNGWKKIGTSIAKNKEVFFENIPSNALFRLVPEKEDRFERIFMIESKTNQIVWY